MNSFSEYVDSLNLKLTSLRKAVLLLLWSANKPLKAYELLNDLLKIKPNATPPTVYRALDFFATKGLIHKIESIQSYTLCCKPNKHFACELLMVCNVCHQVIELHNTSVVSWMRQLTIQHGFHLKSEAIELKGCCQACSLVTYDLPNNALATLD